MPNKSPCSVLALSIQSLLGPEPSATGKDTSAGAISANCQGIAVEREAYTKA